MNYSTSSALLIIDPQNDFCPGGALAVEGGDEIMKGIAAEAMKFKHVIISQDWHPADHVSFASVQKAEPFTNMEMFYGNQTLWPDHCVAGTHGADFHPDVKPAVDRASLIIRKGMNRSIDSYSALFENDRETETGLRGYLYDKKIKQIFLVGLAYDYCVAYSALDIVQKTNMGAFVMKSLTRSIETGDNEMTMTSILENAGVEVI